ncbi:MAG: thioredoxin [Cyanobacteria bacterium J06632_3]
MAVTQEFKSFDDLVNGADQPILVDFYADWCGPCQMMSKILVQVGSQMKGEVKVVKIDTERYPQIASQHSIHALPTLVLFKEGKAVDRIEGVLTADQLVNRVRGVLSGDA